jgi:ATP-binding cassette, subfamily B (MDR/TAP), member 1
MAPLSPKPAADYAALRSPTPSAADKAQAKAEADAPAKHLTTDGSLVPFSQLLRYADATDYALLTVGTLSALTLGLSQPIEGIFFGEFVSSFNAQTAATDRDAFLDGVNTIALKYTLLGVVVLAVAALQVSCYSITASRQAKRIRAAYVGAILKQEIAWFDMNEPGQLSTRVADLTVTIQDGMGRKFADVVQFLAMMIGGVIVGLIKGWQLALVLLAFTPFIALASYVSMKVLATSAQEAIEAYSDAGAVAQESLGNIRTVHMFNSISHFVSKYEAALKMSVESGIKKGFSVGWGTGLVFFVVFCTYACGMFYGGLLVVNDRRDFCEEDCYDGGRVLTVFFSVTMGAIALGQAGPSLEAIYSARAAAYDVFSVIDRTPLIDASSDQGRELPKVSGKIEIDSVTFAYPSRPDTLVCSNYSLTIEPGQTVALVGPSGSGKSTVVSLLERFYDPLRGTVKLDGVDVRDLNVKWLRRQIGLVGQEPALFATSIMENIRHGLPTASDDEVIEAAKMANAYTFIMEFPNGFATEVGERGTQLSGGQKQRVAIARAILKNPSILLLDEATSALDTESERVVQASLDKLLESSTRTTIVVAHRLSTIRNADKIAVHAGGAIVEIGSHDELMKLEDGKYRLLVEAQNSKKSDDDQSETVALPVEQPKALRVKSAVSDSSGMHHRKSRVSQSIAGKQKADEMDGSSDNGSEREDPVMAKGGMRRIWKMSLEDWKYLVLGSCGAVVNAAMFPIWGMLLTKVTVLFFKLDMSREDVLQEARYWAAGFIGIGVVFGLSVSLQQYSFAVAAQRLVARVRLRTYRAMLQQEVGWFDLDENASGALVARLATDTSTLQAVTADTLNRGLVNVTTILLSVSISMAYSWQVTLIVVACAPVIAIASIMQESMVSGTMNTKENNDADNAAGALLSEAIGSIRTVASFGMEAPVQHAYFDYLTISDASDRKVGVVSGVAFGVAQGTMWMTMAFQLWLGGKWVVDRVITFEDLFMVQNVIMLCMFAVGMAMQNLTDNAKAKKSVSQILTVLDRTPAIDSTSLSGDKLPAVHGDLVFKDVQFTYPSRPDAQVYKKYNLTVASGQTVALVGASGSGKSTAISLLERFYDPSAGSVTLDGKDLRSLQLPWLRERISLVSQEPVLFAGSIADNIAMGKPGATRDEIVAAATSANAIGFISNFPEGLDTRVGDRGAQVSGGQKQRIAIARAILRDPEVLLLDEATSALDNESERIVQASLDKLLTLKKRTTIIVAHRLSTIRHADAIAVTRDGEIVEVGTHDELVALPNGVYKSLVGHQAGTMN